MSYTETGPHVAGPTSNLNMQRSPGERERERDGFYLDVAVGSTVGFELLLLLFALLSLLLLLVQLPLDLGRNVGRLRGRRRRRGEQPDSDQGPTRNISLRFRLPCQAH